MLIEEPTLLSTPISTTLGVAAAWLTHGPKGALTARVAAKPPRAVTPDGRTVGFRDGSNTRNTEARPAGTDRRLVREVISAASVITTVVTDAKDDRSPGVKLRRRADRRTRIACSGRVKVQHP